MLDIIQACSKFGIDSILIGAGIWVVWYLIKNTVIRLGSLLDKLSDKIENIGRSLEVHDKDAGMRGQFLKKEHEALIKQHDEMIKVLSRINGYKGGNDGVA